MRTPRIFAVLTLGLVLISALPAFCLPIATTTSPVQVQQHKTCPCHDRGKHVPPVTTNCCSGAHEVMAPVQAAPRLIHLVALAQVDDSQFAPERMFAAVTAAADTAFRIPPSVLRI